MNEARQSTNLHINSTGCVSGQAHARHARLRCHRRDCVRQKQSQNSRQTMTVHRHKTWVVPVECASAMHRQKMQQCSLLNPHRHSHPRKPVRTHKLGRGKNTRLRITFCSLTSACQSIDTHARCCLQLDIRFILSGSDYSDRHMPQQHLF